MPFTSSTISMCSHMAPTDSAPNHRCHAYMRSTPPNSRSTGRARVERRLLQAIIRMETEPMNRAKDALPSPTVSVKANQPTRMVTIAMRGPTSVESTRGECGIRGLARRQSAGDPSNVVATVRDVSARLRGIG
ncbi:unannotated protein [freshwater metagenome]|uniref:Unannotated protein n=1 Tax=freshwater metagenome TaxID=449393 RepID=A0A6J6FVX7_9ZZZZ